MRAISAPLGVIFGVLLALFLVVLATFVAYNTSTSIVESQTSQLIIVGQPAAFYNQSYDKIDKIILSVRNPSQDIVEVNGIEIEGSIIKFEESIKIPPNENVLLKFYDNRRGRRLLVDITYENGTEVVKVSRSYRRQSLSLATQGKVSDDVASGYIEFHLLTDRGAFRIVARIEVSG